jgi:polygalacturonase
MKVILSVVLASCAALVGAAEPQGKIDFNVRDYGGSVAKAAEAAAQAGGGRIVVPPGIWKSGTIWLKDHCELHLEKGAVLRGSVKH